MALIELGSNVGMLGWVGDFLGREERPMDRPIELKNDILSVAPLSPFLCP